MEKSDSRKNVDPNRLKVLVERPRRYQRKRAKIHEFGSQFRSLRDLLSEDEGGKNVPGIRLGMFGIGMRPSPPIQFGFQKMEVVTIQNLCEKLREKTGSSVKEDDFEYGDIVNFGDYRGCGFWYIGGVCHWNRKKWKLVPTWSEYGYGKPIEFSDSPYKYYEEVMHYITRFEEYVDLNRCFGFRQAKGFEEKIKKIKENKGKYVGTTEIDYGEQTIELTNLDTFRDVYFGVVYNDGSFDDSENNFGFAKKEYVWNEEDEERQDEKKEFEEQYELRIKRIRQDIWVVLYGTLYQILPWEICFEMSKFLIL